MDRDPIIIPKVPVDAAYPKIDDDKDQIIELQREVIALQKELIRTLKDELNGR